MRRAIMTPSERIYRREAARYGRQAAGAIRRALEHQQEYEKWVALARRAALDPEETTAPIWRAQADRSEAVAVRQATWAAHEARKAEQLRAAAATEVR
jgi:hypothetical protein